MGFAVTEGMTLLDVLLDTNSKNIQANTGILQLWLGNVIFADHPNFKMKNLKMTLAETHSHEGKPGWKDGGKGTIHLRLKKPEIVVNEDGSKDVTL